MALAQFVYRKSDNVFIGGGFDGRLPPLVAGPPDPMSGNPTQVPDYTNYGVAEFGDADLPDLEQHRYDPQLGKRLATEQELSAQADTHLISASQTRSRSKDVLAICSLIVRRGNPAAWSSMTAAQKRTAVLAAANEWRDLRVAADDLLVIEKAL